MQVKQNKRIRIYVDLNVNYLIARVLSLFHSLVELVQLNLCIQF